MAVTTHRRDNWSHFYVPEIHDIHAEMDPSLDVLLEALSPPARTVCALLVVPNWQDRALLTPDALLAGRLRDLPGTKVLHGWTHSLGRTVASVLLHGHDDRGEFARLDLGEATRRLVAGRRCFEDCIGTAPTWFCAPQWRQSAPATSVLRTMGLHRTMFADRVAIAERGDIPLPALNFDVGARAAVQAVHRPFRQRWIDRALRTGTPFRLALHPADALRPKIWSDSRNLIDRLDADGWQPIGIDDAVRRWPEAA